jgi:hypothetical protein
MAYLLKDIIKHCSPYFKSTTIVDTGATDDTAQLPVNVINLHDWNDDWVKAYMTAIRDIPIGDWFLFMDSDEFPNLKLCQGIQELVNDCDVKGFNVCGLRGLLHIYGWDGKLEYTEMSPNWRKRVLVKKLSDIYATANGSHCEYFQVNRKLTDTPPEFFYNHLKSRFTLARSRFTQGFRFPSAFALENDTTMIEAFNSKTGLVSCADFLKYLEGSMDGSEAFDRWADCKDLDDIYDSRTLIYNLLIVNKGKQFVPIFCHNDCCKY